MPISWIRPVLGARVRGLLEPYEDVVEFYSPGICFNETRQHLLAILERRGLNLEPVLRVPDGHVGAVSRQAQRDALADTYWPWRMRVEEAYRQSLDHTISRLDLDAVR